MRMELVWFAVGLAAGVLGVGAWTRQKRADRTTVEPAAIAETADFETISDAGAPPPLDAPASAEDRLQAAKRAVEAQDDAIQRPADLLQQASFNEGTDLLAGTDFDAARVIDSLTAQGYALPSMAANALARRDDIEQQKVLDALPNLGAYAMHFVLGWLQTRPDATALGAIVLSGREWWWDYAGLRADLRVYLQWAALHPGHEVAQTVSADLDEGRLAECRDTWLRFQDPVLQPHIDGLQAAIATRRERRVLAAIGRLGHRPSTTPRFETPALRLAVDELQRQLEADTPRSHLVVGEPGVGKSALLDLLFQRLAAHEDWLLFEAGAADVLAGQKYIGELEERLREMLVVLHRRRAVWRVPDFFDLLHKGSHHHDPRGILDLLLPSMERGELLLVGEISPAQLAKLLLARPAVARLFDNQLLLPAQGTALADLGAHWATATQSRLGREVADATTLAEAVKVAAQYFPDQHEPGRSLRLLEDALMLAQQRQPPSLPLDGNALLAAVGARSGMPLDVIDDRQRLSLDRLREVFRRRVVGQDEAIECLVDRIAMLKAGLTDSRRPIGVFLFAGPTGTGKTELAKALGELLFGSDERLLRLDMSEYQGHDAAHRLIAAAGQDGGTRSLVTRIREQPFSVVLLDEFEKAHPNVWDLFLQVFDDGRLSDQNGNTADFRHSIIILTSNVGSTISRSAGPGFVSKAGGYSRDQVEKALYATFRREFLNRLDRVVLFHPLDRNVMRGILYKELDLALTRRGLRNRGWAVEWEPSAIEFLLDKGFTPDLGARPLRRAIEDHLLAPLARSIVEHQAPQGDQFLFVRRNDDRLDAVFIDPDTDTDAAPSAIDAPSEAGDDDLGALVYASRETAIPRDVLARQLERLAARVATDLWTEPRSGDYIAMAAEGFWSDGGRFQVLERIERRDRIESALDTAERLLARVPRSGERDLSARLAQLLYLLELAIRDIDEARPQDAIVSLRLGEAERVRHPSDARQWWQQVLRMYLQWAAQRGMRVQMLEQDPERGAARFAVSGFGAYRLLSREVGLHLLESDDENGTTRRVGVQVDVAPDGAGAPTVPSSLEQGEREICRRYRLSPSPLARDARAGWRTGRVERVLAGDFDVMR
jgi:ATP-dependent Clp protease ATP-binding subunit ClpC